MQKFVGTCLLLICAPLSAAERTESFSASVEIFSDGSDRVWASIDRDDDGIVDNLIGLTVEAKYPSEVLSALPWRFDSAIVSLSDRRLGIENVLSRDRVTMSLGDADGASSSLQYESGRTVLSLLDGAALSYHSLEPRQVFVDDVGDTPRLGFEDVPAWTRRIATLDRSGPTQRRDADEKNCQAGGDGSTTCSAGCGLDYEADVGAASVGVGAGLGSSSSCSTSCKSGYYACCNCEWNVYWVGSAPVVYQEAGCECVR